MIRKMIKNLKHSILFILILVILLLVVIVSLAASKPVPNINIVTVGTQMENSLKSGKWSGLGMGLYSEGKGAASAEEFDSAVDILLSNGFTDLRIDGPDYQNTTSLVLSKAAVIKAVAKGAKVTWLVSSNSYNNPDWKITAANWPTFRQAILDAAAWAQANGVYEFQLGNEEENHIDGTTMTVSQLMINLKSVATDVQSIFTNGNVSYTCARWSISDWITLGRGDIDILASNIYRDHNGVYDDFWKTQIGWLLWGFDADHTGITEFGLDGNAINNYSTDEVVQAAATAEMVEYIKNSGLTKANYFCFNGNLDFSVVKSDGTYRKLWNQAF
jgi:hypothetical protein